MDREISLVLPEKIVHYLEGRRVMFQRTTRTHLLFKTFASEYVQGLIENRIRGKA